MRQAQRVRALALIGALTLLPRVAAAEGSGEVPFDLVADEVTYDQVRDVYEATGHVHVVQPGKSLEADWVVFNGTSHVGIAVGSVRLRDGGETLLAEFATIDFETLTALALDAKLDSEATGLVVESEALLKTGEATYAVERATLTTCRCAEPDDLIRRDELLSG